MWWGFVVGPDDNGYSIDGATPSGYWSLNYSTYGIEPPTGGQIRLLDVPMDRGNWIDVKMHVGWYDTSSGFVKVWVNGERKDLRYTSFGSATGGDTFTGRTVWNNTSGTFYYKEGLYRDGDVSYPDAVVYHANYRSATDEAGL